MVYLFSVDTYNAKNSEQGGKAILQWYEKYSDMSDVEEEPKKKRRKRDHSDKPLIIAICTPLMSRAHKNICQAGELVFLDSSSSMDRFNASIFIMSTHSSSGIPLGVILTSDEREETIYNGLELLKSVMQENEFFGRSSRAGPQVFMIDDSYVRPPLKQISSYILCASLHLFRTDYNSIVAQDRLGVAAHLGSKLMKIEWPHKKVLTIS